MALAKDWREWEASPEYAETWRRWRHAFGPVGVVLLAALVLRITLVAHGPHWAQVTVGLVLLSCVVATQRMAEPPSKVRHLILSRPETVG